ncbi:hypothetical protein Peur_000230 [Populus x canadensis]
MDDHSWMYRDSPHGLRRMDYCNGVQGFLNFATSIPKNFTGGGIRCPCRKCENKKYLHPDVVMMHLLHKGFMENYQCWYAHGEVFVSESERRMEETVVGSTSSASNVYEAANDNTNPYRNMIMDAMRMNQGNGGQCPIVEEEPNADATRFFDLLKDSDEPLWDGCMNHSKLSAVAQVFTIKSDHGLSEAGYDKIVEWARSILPEGNRLKENFYAAKSMMKPLGLGYQKIDMCPNFCMLYYLENAEMTECMTCGHSRYKPRIGRGKTLVAYKKLRYFPITPRLQRGRVEVVQDENEDTSVRDEVFQVSEVVEPYRVAPSIELEENSNFRVFDDSLVDVDVEELNFVLSSSGQANIDEEDDIHIEDCNEGDDNSIDDEEEENSD